jgi:hypothetical protein
MGSEQGITAMIAALAAIEYLGRITDKFFEAQMKRPRSGSRSVRKYFPYQ